MNTEENTQNETPTVSIDSSEIASQVAKQLEGRFPAEQKPNFEELDYDERDTQLHSEVTEVKAIAEHTRAVMEAQRQVPKVTQDLLKDAPEHLKAEAARYIEDALSDSVTGNPNIVKSLDGRAKEMLVAAALHTAGKKVGSSAPAVEPLGDIPDGVENTTNYRKVAAELKQFGITDPERIKAAAMRYREA